MICFYFRDISFSRSIWQTLSSVLKWKNNLTNLKMTLYTTKPEGGRFTNSQVEWFYLYKYLKRKGISLQTRMKGRWPDELASYLSNSSVLLFLTDEPVKQAQLKKTKPFKFSLRWVFFLWWLPPPPSGSSYLTAVWPQLLLPTGTVLPLELPTFSPICRIVPS